MSDNNIQDNQALTPAQKEYTSSKGAFTKYRLLVSGNSSLLWWFWVELYNLILAPLPSFLGIALRSIFLKLILNSSSSGSARVERLVSFRSPQRITLADKVIVDQNCTFDARISTETSKELGIKETANEIYIGPSCFIGAYSMILAKRGSITLEQGVNVSTFCRIASEGRIVIGKAVLISAYCYIGPGNHKISDPRIPISQQGMEPGKGITIGDNSWIGAHSTIMDGVTIGKNVVVGAHSFVRNDVPDNCIVAGVPAKIIKNRLESSPQ